MIIRNSTRAAVVVLVFVSALVVDRTRGAIPRLGVRTAYAQSDCVNRSGPFAWSCRGPIAGMACTQILETADPYTWGDNYFCSAVDIGMRWSMHAPIAGMRCTQILETADPHTWSDNYLCVPPQSPFVFVWWSAGPVPGLPCVQWSEPADPHTWNDNYLCYARVASPPSGDSSPIVTPQPFAAPPPVSPPPGGVAIAVPPGPIAPPMQVAPQTPSCVRQVGQFTWSCAGPVAGQVCTQILESADPHTWDDNYLCARRDLGIRWSSHGAVPGMRCTQILESADPHTWHDNFLCVPPSSRFWFMWSSAGPIAARRCLQWEEPADPHTWHDNYLCW